MKTAAWKQSMEIVFQNPNVVSFILIKKQLDFVDNLIMNLKFIDLPKNLSFFLFKFYFLRIFYDW